MDVVQVVVTTAFGLVATVVTALVTSTLTRAQERRKHEREVASKLADLNSDDPATTRMVAVQHGHACSIAEQDGVKEKDRVFLPAGSRILLGNQAGNHIVVQDNNHVMSKTHAAFLAQGSDTYLEPLGATLGIAVNGNLVTAPRKPATGDVVTVPGGDFKVTFVPLKR